MLSRKIRLDRVMDVIETGEVIREYPDDFPYPSFLLLKISSGSPLHVVLAQNIKEKTCIIVTTYEPDPEKWDLDFRLKSN